MPLIQQQTPNTAIQPATVAQMQSIVTAPSSGSFPAQSTTQTQTSLQNQMVQHQQQPIAMQPGFQGWSGQQLLTSNASHQMVIF